MSGKSYRYFVVYKPYGVLPQFTDEQGRPTLKSLGDFPRSVYPVGRLDLDSEGLLLLTDDAALNARLLHPSRQHWRTYWVQVEGTADEAALQKLRDGLPIRPRKTLHQTLPARARRLEPPAELPEREPPVRFRKQIPTSWLALSLREGKYRQVRKMTAAVGLPTLRLIRVAIERLELGAWQPGWVAEYERDELYALLFARGD